MRERVSYETARALAAGAVTPVGEEQTALEDCAGRVLARELRAAADVPAFDRSAYDGYAFRAEDVKQAAADRPVVLRVTQEIPAGGMPRGEVRPGTAAKVLTGAPIPPGADAVMKYEDTRFTADRVELPRPARPGQNIVRAGEDVRAGTVLAQAGSLIDPGLAGTLAAQGLGQVWVRRVPQVGLLSTGSELVEAGEPLEPGKIYNSGRHALAAAIQALGCRPVWLGRAEDGVEAIRERLEDGLERCDALVVTGGASRGSYDLTPAAMERAGAELLFRGVDFKPGMACAYAVGRGKLICGLSGNPAAALTNFHLAAASALKKLAGRRDHLPREVTAALAVPFPKASPMVRVLRGRLALERGRLELELSGGQGNVVLSSAAGCDMLAVVPAGSGPLPAGTELRGILI
ncbi:MAG: molybdopterin molybdotransferase MoeA [Oscillospiraceae bacterium]|nr:molybdopterin molybdotransferase MoeA [Oscillospiraceae bacterium]